MLALPISAPVVPASANLPFLLTLDAEGELDSNECEGVRDLIPSGLPSFGEPEEGVLATLEAFCFSLSPLSV